MTPKSIFRIGWTACTVGVALAAVVARAQDAAEFGSELLQLESHAARLARHPVQVQGPRGPRFVEERLAEGELYYRLHDYERASILLYDIVEHHQNHVAYPDALMLLGDTLAAAGDSSGARMRYQEVLDHAHEPRFRGYLQRAMVALLEIVTQTRDFTDVDRYVSKLDQFSSTPEFAAAVSYFRGKLLYLKAVPVSPAGHAAADDQRPLDQWVADPQLLDLAKRSFDLVPVTSPLHSGASYFAGTICVLRGQLSQAIGYFNKAALAPVSTDDQRAIQELANLALGRVYYELDDSFRAIPFYQSIPSTSPRFDAAQYELAWVYLRVGDSDRAQRALEALAVASPNSRYIPDAGILRGNLLIREGKHVQAHKVFTEVKQRFEPVVHELDTVLQTPQPGHESSIAYFQSLVAEHWGTLKLANTLPPNARRWVRPEGKFEPAVAVAVDVGETNIKREETQHLARRLDSTLEAGSAVTAFRDSREHRQQTIAIRNRFTELRRSMIRAEAKSIRTFQSPELQKVRQERLMLESALDKLPTNPAEFLERDATIDRQRVAYEREMSRLTTELAGLDARIAALQSYLADDKRPVRLTDEERTKVLAEVATQRELTAEFRATLSQLKDDVERNVLQSGVGDERYREDAELRLAYRRAVDQEHALLARAGAPQASTFGRHFERIQNGERLLDQADVATDDALTARVQTIREAIQKETQSLAKQEQDTLAVRKDTEEIVGVLMYDSLRRARARFHDITLKADVGVVDIAWADREEHRMRVDTLSRERARSLQVLEDEFRDIVGQDQSTPENTAGSDSSSGGAL
jgi:tetratricopeptide (TPR) repeat protein